MVEDRLIDEEAPPKFRPNQHRLRKPPAWDNAFEVFGHFSQQLFGCTICTVDGSTDYQLRMNEYSADCGDEAGKDYYEDFLLCDYDESDDDLTERKVQKSEADQILKSLLWNNADLFDSEGWKIIPKREPNRYNIQDRLVRIFLLPEGTKVKDYSHHLGIIDEESASQAARIMVQDGPLKQPLLDYLRQTGKNEHYDARGTENPVGVSGMAKLYESPIPRAALGDVRNNGTFTGSRIDAMKAASVQATVRRKNYTTLERFEKLGQTVISSSPHGPVSDPAGSVMRPVGRPVAELGLRTAQASPTASPQISPRPLSIATRAI